ncbi:SDR family oxidoreductase [Candidatus Viridilinea mediisalina]|uniref:Short-chain dehydrogenase n=1 Tax=Candidatus Viridilinea mediisalina TaxID=2024553 RepID=A0A2A6RI87_9CHLR|nr:SDR family oxidoreductase [Candidatus Viridilinea mediisalina]PDW02732.1 short-chain dehydrogenase [Candidatus Viridilinea mediisalina]
MTAPTAAGRLNGKIAMITGAAGAIGEVITRRFLDEGATVVISGRNDAKLQSFRAKLLAQEGVAEERVVAITMDGRDSAAVRVGVADVVRQLGRIDVLVNNAGGDGPHQPLVQIPLGTDALDDTSLTGAVASVLGIAWNFIRAVAPHMPPGGSVINVSTIFSRADYYGRISYVVPKAALNALSQTAARELGDLGVRVNLIYPGPIEGERIRGAFQAMDELKGQAAQTTADQFLNVMRLGRPDAEGRPVRSFPHASDVASTALFLASDDAAALSGESLEVTNGMDLPAESHTTFTARPGLRAVDGSNRVVLICAGDQLEDVMALTGVLRSCGADAVIGLRSREAIALLESSLAESRRFAGASFIPPIIVHLDPREPTTIDAALALMLENTGGPHGAIILPARAKAPAERVVTAPDEQANAFLNEEIAGTVAITARLAHHWQQVRIAPGAPSYQPRVIFMSNGDDRRGNVLADVARAGIEQLVRVWRHEAHLDHERSAPDELGQPLPPIWANQIIRYVNHEDDSLDFACAATAQLLLSNRQIEEINLYLPTNLAATTGSGRPSFGWAESLIGLHLGKVAMITGGSAGIGGQVGRLLALAGARVMLAARDKVKLDQIRNSIVGELLEVGYNDADARVQVFPDCDVAREADMAALVERTLATFGRVDYLLNNAGIAGEEEMVLDMPIKGWRHTLNANLISNYSLIRKLAPLMKQQGSGYILNVSSYFGGEKYAAISYPNRADYAVSKAGQRALSEALARFLGPEVQINALAPGPVEGDRLKGSGERPGLFMRRARLILENKRLNDIYGALIQARRDSDHSVADLLACLTSNKVAMLSEDEAAPPALRRMAASFVKDGDLGASSGVFLMNRSIAEKLLERLKTGGYLTETTKHASSEELVSIQPPEPFFARAQIEREARKVRDGVMGMLYLQRMPTEYDVAIATVYYLADRAVSGETFHPSGGLRYERTPVGGELFGQASTERMAQLVGSTVYLVGEYLDEHLEVLARAYLERHGAAQVVLITETEAGIANLSERLRDHADAGRIKCIAAGTDLEGAFDRAMATYGRPGPIVSTPFRPLPTAPLVGRVDSDWSTVLDEQGFADLCEQQLTHHFRVARKASLIDGAALAMVTPETTATSPTEQFALANFVKTTLHAFTATVGTESERTVHRILVNQVDLTRQARAEEPRSDAERNQELERFIQAVVLTTAPLPPTEDSRYSGRINRGSAITV